MNTKNDTPWWVPLPVIALFAPIIVGPILAFWLDDPQWLWGLAFLIFFLS